MQSILIVEDDPHMLALMKDYFLLKKFKVITATTTEEATKALSSHHFRFLITDMQLEERNAGLKILDFIKQNKLNTVNFICTGYEEELKDTTDTTNFYYLKPIDLDVIYNDISKIKQ